MNYDEITDLRRKIVSQWGDTPVTNRAERLLLIKTEGFLVEAAVQDQDKPYARKLVKAAIGTLLRGYGVKDAPRGKRAV